MYVEKWLKIEIIKNSIMKKLSFSILFLICYIEFVEHYKYMYLKQFWLSVIKQRLLLFSTET